MFPFGSTLLLTAQTAKLHVVRGLMTEQTNDAIALPKNPLKSRRFWGFVVVALEIAEILSGDPLSLNGYIKWILFASGSGLWLWGELMAVQPIGFKIWGRA